GAIAGRLALTVIGGIGCGALVATPLSLFAGRAGDRLVETTLSMIIAYGSFLLAERFHCSGVLATLTAGMIVGNYGFMRRISTESR
ncbi:cation:proton antiporter, partial [Acinetobacter baumannii]